MKLIHLSDLHLGKRVNEVSMIEDQEYILHQIVRIVKEETADAVLIAGDVYDKSVPSAEAVTLFDDFLNRLVQLKVKVFVISGNHDSPERLAFGSKLMTGAGICVSPVYNGTVAPIKMEDEHGVVNFWLLSFIKPIHVKKYFPDDNIESYTDAVRVAVKNMNIDIAGRNVLLTHQFVTGASTCESEEISVGGSDNVDASVFADFDYVALGHIHGPQNIGSNKIRYCGTPLKYSFSEAGHYKSVTVVNLGAKDELLLETIPLVPLHDMRQIRGTFAEVTNKSFYADTDTNDYLQVTLTDEEDIQEAIGQLRMIYPNIMKLNYDNTRTRMNQMIDGVRDVENKPPMELFEELYSMQNNQPMSDVQKEFLQRMIETIKESSV